MSENGSTFSREPREYSFVIWKPVVGGSAAATLYASWSGAHEIAFVLQLVFAPLERAPQALPLWYVRMLIRFQLQLLRHFAIRSIRAPVSPESHSNLEDTY
jgi:hypothetical protein